MWTPSLYSTPRSGRSTLTPLHLKNAELDNLKKEAKQHLRKLNSLYLDYTDWFQKQSQSFLDAIKTVQVLMPSLVPKEIECMQDFRKTLEMARTLETKGRKVKNLDKMQLFLDYWVRFCDLRDELELDILLRLGNFCRSVTSLRREEVKTQIDWLEAEMNMKSPESYNFTKFHNTKENLYTYKIMVPDQRFLGLVGYLPHLIGYATRICYMIGKVHVERE